MNIDNRFEDDLRKQEAEQAPDLSHMEAHWQQMQMMLQGPVAPASPSFVKRFWWLIPAVILFIGIGWWLMQPGENNRQNVMAPAVQKGAELNNTNESFLVDSAVINEPIVSNAKIAPYLTDDDILLAGMKLNFKPCDICPDTTNKRNDSIVAIVPRQQILARLLDSIKQLAQQFIIQQQRDTLLLGANGTGLFIPAGSFSGSGEIKIQLREFYTKSAMLAEGLTTQSNERALISGGMVEVLAFQDEKPIALPPGKLIYWFLPDTASSYQSMHLFKGMLAGSSSMHQMEDAAEKSQTMNDTVGLAALSNGRPRINWQSISTDFQQFSLRKEVYVQNLINQPYKVKPTRKGEVASFIVREELKMEPSELKRILKDKYGYRKVKLRTYGKRLFWYKAKNQEFNTEYAENIGDSMWMRAEYAQQYNLASTATRWVPQNSITAGAWLVPQQELASNLATELNNRYQVKLQELGWVNCDRFASFSGGKTQVRINLKDDAQYYFTCLIFDQYNCILRGNNDGNEVLFNSIPLNEKVKILSVGVDANGKAIYALQEIIVGKEPIIGLNFIATDASVLKNTLSK